MGQRTLMLKNLVITKQVIAYWFVLALGLIAIAAKYKYNGLVFGFDYGMYQPDGKYYTYMALDFINNDPKQSAQSVVNWYATHGFKGNIFQVSDLVPDTSPVYQFISNRILYPILSIPFVYMFGIPGMIVVPALSFLLLLYVVLRLSSRYNRIYVGVIICFVLSISPTVMRWMVVNTTDALLVGLFSYSVILLTDLKSNTKIAYLQLFPLIILTAATRFSLVFWVAIGLVLFIHRKKLLAICILMVAFICSIPALNTTLSVSLLPNSKELSTIEKILSLPISFFKVIFIDIAQLAVLDRAFLAFLITGVLLAIIQIRNVASQYFVAVLLAGYILGAINGTLGVNFRYQMPAIPFCAWAIISSLSLLSAKPVLFSFLRPHIKTQEAQ
jgi:hypothetical protein